MTRQKVDCPFEAGTLRSAEIKPDLPPSLFPVFSDTAESGNTREYPMNSGRRRSSNLSQEGMDPDPAKDSFDSDDLLFDDFLDMGTTDALSSVS